MLKQNGKLAFSFHHSRAEGWAAIAQAISDSGFFVFDVFPIHAELMASTPKAAANDPISLDAIIVCSKESYDNGTSIEACIAEYSHYSKLLLDKGKAISVADRFVILASQLMRYCVNNRLNYAKTKGIIEAAHPELVSSSNTYQETFFGSL